MKYRIQVTVTVDRIPAIVEAVFKGVDFDPELKLWPYVLTKELPPPAKPEPPRRKAKPRMGVLPHDVVGVRRELPNRRAELLEAALKTGPKRWSELRAALSSGGLAESSLNNMIGQWKKAGRIARSDNGLWSLTDAEEAHA